MERHDDTAIPTESGGLINRRQMLGLGATTVGALAIGALPLAASVSAAPVFALGFDGPGAVGLSSAVSAAPLAVSAATAGLRYRNLTPVDFFGYPTTVERAVLNGNPLGVWPTVNGFLISGIELPTDSVAVEMSVFATNTSAGSFPFFLQSLALDGTIGPVHATVNVPAATTSVTEFKVNFAHAALVNSSYIVGASMLGNGTQRLYGMRLGYTAPGAINLVAGTRVLPNQTLANGASVVVDCSGSAPAGAKAVLVTILAFATTSDGYLSCYADGAANPLTINCYWAAGMQTATAAIVPISAARRMKMTLTTGGGSVGVAVDIAGYLL